MDGWRLRCHTVISLDSAVVHRWSDAVKSREPQAVKHKDESLDLYSRQTRLLNTPSLRHAERVLNERHFTFTTSRSSDHLFHSSSKKKFLLLHFNFNQKLKRSHDHIRIPKDTMSTTQSKAIECVCFCNEMICWPTWTWEKVEFPVVLTDLRINSTGASDKLLICC